MSDQNERRGGDGWGGASTTGTYARQRRKRITLDFVGAPLLLPGETEAEPPIDVNRFSEPPRPSDPPRNDPADLSGEFVLPEDHRLFAQAARRAASRSAFNIPVLPPDDGESDGADAWTRTRERTSQAPRARNDTPQSALDLRVLAARMVETKPPPTPVESTEAVVLVSSAAKKPATRTQVDLRSEMADRFALGDFTGSLRAAELLLGRDPKDNEANQHASACRDRLSQLHLSRLGGSDRVPTVAVADSEIRWLGLDHRAGFLLSHIDGMTTVEEVIDLSGMPRHEALKLLLELRESGAIRLEG